MAAVKKKPAAKPKPKAAPKAAAPKPVAVAIKKSTPVKPAPAPAPPKSATAVAATPAIDHGAVIAALWIRLETWVAAAGAPPLGLAPPASEKAIKAAEKDLGLTFPADYRASLRLHDGQAGGPTFPWMPGCTPLLSLDDIVAARTKLARQAKPKVEAVEANGRIKSGVARPGRIPIAGNAFLDLDPGPAGVAGQLIALVTERDFVVVDTSFTAALERWVAVLERGIWTYTADQHAVHPRALVAQSGHPAGWFSKR